MRLWQLFVLGAGAGAATVAIAARADDPPFAVNPGLWQMTTSASTAGAPPVPPAAFANLSPEQRAQVEAAVKAAMARMAKPHSVKACLTAEQLRHTPDFTHGNKWSCKQTVVTRTATEIALNTVCSDPTQGSMSGSVHFTAVDRETIAGTTHFVRSNNGQAMTMDQTISGKWLGADCGDVKPHQTP